MTVTERIIKEEVHPSPRTAANDVTSFGQFVTAINKEKSENIKLGQGKSFCIQKRNKHKEESGDMNCEVYMM